MTSDISTVQHPTKFQRWTAVSIFFMFMLLHQTDRLLIGPLTSDIMSDFHLSESEMGSIFTISLILGSVFYPIWGYLFDRFARPKILAAASLIWGMTTWLSAAAPTARLFTVSRASTGIDDSSYPGIASLISDYFPPDQRSGVFGFLQLTIPLGYLAGLFLAMTFRVKLGWRFLYLLTGLLGIIMAVLIRLGVREVPRGSSEPELKDIQVSIIKVPGWTQFKHLLKIPTLRTLFLQGAIGVLPWQVITFWSFRYLEIDRGLSPDTITAVMTPAILMIALGYFLGGVLGDAAYRKDPRGRLLVALAGVILGALLLSATLNISLERPGLFRIFLSMTCFFIPLASPNIATAVYDVVLPEVRSSATSVQYFLGNLGSAFAPLIAGVIAERSSLQTAIFSISIVSWGLSALILAYGIKHLPADMNNLRSELEHRAQKFSNSKSGLS
jgi:MFS family permease